MHWKRRRRTNNGCTRIADEPRSFHFRLNGDVDGVRAGRQNGTGRDSHDIEVSQTSSSSWTASGREVFDVVRADYDDRRCKNSLDSDACGKVGREIWRVTSHVTEMQSDRGIRYTTGACCLRGSFQVRLDLVWNERELDASSGHVPSWPASHNPLDHTGNGTPSARQADVWPRRRPFC